MRNVFLNIFLFSSLLTFSTNVFSLDLIEILGKKEVRRGNEFCSVQLSASPHSPLGVIKINSQITDTENPDKILESNELISSFIKDDIIRKLNQIASKKGINNSNDKGDGNHNINQPASSLENTRSDVVSILYATISEKDEIVLEIKNSEIKKASIKKNFAGKFKPDFIKCEISLD